MNLNDITSASAILSFLLATIITILWYFCYNNNRKIKIAFFHPYSCHGGGGEKVLWIMIHSLLSNMNDDDISIHIYTGDVDYSKDQMLEIIKNQFKIEFTPLMKSKLHLCYIHSRHLMNPKLHPYITMLFQSLASILIVLEGLWKLYPTIFIDTTGVPFSYPFVRLFSQAYVIAYVHYPIISTDMLQAVRNQRPSYNNKSIIATNISISSLKLLYYQLFAYLYTWVGQYAQLSIVNSTWTENHIKQLWGFHETIPVSKLLHISDSTIKNATTDSSTATISQINTLPKKDGGKVSYKKRLIKVYPPCKINHLFSIPLHPPPTDTPSATTADSIDNTNDNTSNGNSSNSSIVIKPRERNILSIGQFRPEKDHKLQLYAFQLLIQSGPIKYTDVKLILLGSSRNEEDAQLVNELKTLAIELHIHESVEFVINASYATLLEYLETTSIGLHTMWNEHFGISVVEMMAAGMIMISHNSGGPKQDIVVPYRNKMTNEIISIGYLAETAEDYATSMRTALNMNDSEQRHMRWYAREAMKERFADHIFEKVINEEFTYLIRNI